MNWFELTLLHIVFIVAVSLINKKTLLIKDLDELMFSGFAMLITGIISFGVSISEGFNFIFTSESLYMILAMIITYVIAMSLFFTGLKNIELSQTAILDSTGSIWGLMLGTFFLQEVLNILKVIGILLIIVANVVLFYNSNKFKLGKYQKFILAAAFFYALGALWDKKLNSYGTPLSYIAISFTLVGLVMLIVYLKRVLLAFKFTFRKTDFWRGVLVNGVLYTFAFWAFFKAYQQGGEVSRMVPMALSTSVIIPVMGIVVLKEYDKWKQKLVAIMILLTGLWFIKG